MQEQDRTAVLSGAEVGLRSLWLSVFQGVSLEDFLLAPVRGQSEENPLRSMCTPPRPAIEHGLWQWDTLILPLSYHY